MRYYDVKTGRRFDQNHELWIKHFRNKNGTIKSRMDWKLAEELEAQGIIHLVPSTTEIAKVADAAGAVGAGAQGGCEIGLTQMIAAIPDWLAERDNGSVPTEEDYRALFITGNGFAQAEMVKARNKGSELHDAFHRWLHNDTGHDWTDEHETFVVACNGVLAQLGIAMGEYDTELQFACDTHGGTADLVANSRSLGLDWKTVKKHRPPKPSEIIQMGGYSLHFGFDKGVIAYYHQTEHTFRVVGVDPILPVARKAFLLCRDVLMLTEEIMDGIS